MTHPIRIRLPAALAAQLELASGDHGSRSALIRHVLNVRSDDRLRPIDTSTADVQVRLDDELRARVEAAAERAGMPVEAWCRAALEIEMGLRGVLDAGK